MAEYKDKVVSATVDLLNSPDDGGSGGTGGGNFEGLVTENSASVGLTGLGITNSPLQASINISEREDNQLSVISIGEDTGLYVKNSETKVSSKIGNNIKVITAEEAASSGNPLLEGIYVDPLYLTGTSPTNSISLTQDTVDRSKTYIDILIDGTDAFNAVKNTSTGLRAGVSKLVDNILVLRNGELYVPPQSVKGDKGDPGEKGDKGDPGLGLNVLGVLDSVEDLPDVNGYLEGDTWVIQGHFWAKVNDVWTDLGSFIGPDGLSAFEVAEQNGFVGTVDEWLASLKGADGIGLRILGSFTDTSQLPSTGNASGDAYIIDEQMWVWDSTAWKPVGQVGPEGKSAYKSWLDVGNVGSEAQFISSLKGETGERGPQGVQGSKGEAGQNANTIKVLGRKETSTDLPSTGNQPGDAWFVDQNVYAWDGTTWLDLGPLQGPKGDTGPQGVQGQAGADGQRGPQGYDNYQLWQLNGNTGSYSDFLESQRGPQGLTGPRGINGEKGERGEKGDTGTGITVKGKVATSGDLPTTGNIEGDAFLVGLDLYVFIGGSWTNVGPFQGPKGDTGSQGATGSQGLKGDKGDRGEKGIDGNPLIAKGTKNSVSELPSGNNSLGDMWYVLGKTYIWNGTVWVDMGTNVGPQGSQGLKGDQGIEGKSAYEVWVANGNTGTESDYLASLKGAKGDKGDTGATGPEGPQGAGVKILGKLPSTDDLPTTGTLGEGYIIGQNFWVWTGTAYEDVGPIQGPKGDPGVQGPVGRTGDTGAKGETGAKGDPGNRWIVGNGEPTPATGTMGDYYLDSAAQEIWQKVDPVLWQKMEGHLGGGNVYDAPSDDRRKVRLNGDWVDETQAQEIVSVSGGVINLGLGSVMFKAPSTTSAFTFTNPPASNVGLPFTIVITGKPTTAPTWPSSVKWNNGQAPDYGDNKTTIVMLWDGVEYLASKGPSY